ncbi:MAG: GTPase domain-containing protein [Myxococcota bacterium]
MFFVWRHKRINVKWAWWGAPDSGKTTALHALAAEIDERVEAPEEPAAAVGMRRNDVPVEVDDPDVRFSTYFCHPPGDLGAFGGFPVHYQIKTPEQPLEGNRALDKVLDGISVIILCVDATRERQEANDAALRDLVKRLAAREELELGAHRANLEGLFGAGGAYRLVVQFNKVDRDDAVAQDAAKKALFLPDSVPTVETVASEPRGIWQLFETACEQTRPLIEAAQERGRIPRH